ncbi:MAG TPA: hypothetical protein VMI30_00455 [Stellaceae bacterium]|nr:hypothetical protein [Stellaceae bacterium]
MNKKQDVRFCRSRAAHYRKVADMVSDPNWASFYRGLADTFADEAKTRRMSPPPSPLILPEPVGDHGRAE